MARILVVDDEPGICLVLNRMLADQHHAVVIAPSGERAIEATRSDTFDLALIDVSLPGIDGLQTFTALRKLLPDLQAVFITAFGSIRSAIDATKAGAFDYVTKPFDNEELMRTVDQALQLGRLGREVVTLREQLHGRSQFPQLIGTSAVMRDLLRTMSKVAATDATVLILGESGTGKELVARSLHRQSRRAGGPFVAVNCSAIPAGLVESEFFGHERGAFTDAKEHRIGRLEQAHQGTLFLDEIGDLPREAQAKLLRVLEDREVTHVGGRKPIRVDIRVLAATNHDLQGAVAKGDFREDLYWRLHVVTLALPPLRSRREDIDLLIDYFLDRLNLELNTDVTGVAAEARRRLIAYDWPGNIRELENAMRHALVLAEASCLQLSDFPKHISQVCGVDPAPADRTRLSLTQAATRAVERVERTMIEGALVQFGGNRGAAATALGINRKTLFNKMRAYGLADPGEGDSSE